MALLLWIPATVVTQDKPKAWPRDKALALAQKYVRSNDDAERDRILADLAAIDDFPVEQGKNFAAQIHRIVMSAGPRLRTGDSKFEHPLYPGQIIVRGQGGGLLVTLHGGGAGSGSGGWDVSLYGDIAAKAGVGIFPTVLKKRDLEWSTYPEEQRYVYELIRAAKRSFPIDSARVYLMGASMGGCGSWTIGSLYADLFAGVGLAAGGPCGASFANFLNTPLWIYHGDRDDRAPVAANRAANQALGALKERYGPFEFVYHEGAGVGHQWPREDRAEAGRFLLAKKKNFNAPRVLWEPRAEWKKVFYWLMMERPARGVRIFAEFKGRSEIHVETSGSCSGLSLILNDGLADLKSPIKVVLNGQEIFNDRAAGSATAALLSLDDKLDLKAACWARIRLEAGGR
jgi:poly(3-hydroxybutyrate) depolymerase